jgi:hypothetical protein
MHLHRFTFFVGLAVGFVAGTRAGREKYDQMVKLAKETMDNPNFQQAAGTFQTQATNLMSTASHKFAEVAPQLAHTAAQKVDGLRHRNGHGESDSSTGAEGAPFAATSNSHLGSGQP